ncbi:MAG: type II toxin-antitoxin system ParD family antitoxin [Crocosphaera sp.]
MIKITLKQEQETFIQEKLNSGEYNNIDEIITEALLLLQQRDKHYQQWIK